MIKQVIIIRSNISLFDALKFVFHPSVDGRLEYIGEDNGCKKTHKRRKTDTADGRMLCQKHATDSSDEHDGTEHDGGLVGFDDIVLTCQTVHDEDTVIDTDTEDKGGDDDTDQVELHIKEHHHTQHDEPTE